MLAVVPRLREIVFRTSESADNRDRSLHAEI